MCGIKYISGMWQWILQRWSVCLSALHTQFWEQRCPVCLEPWCPAESELCCPQCQSNLPQRTMGFCPLCGEPLAHADACCVPCDMCLQNTPPWAHFVFYGIYEQSLRDLLLRYKFHSELCLGTLLGNLLLTACAPLNTPHVLVPIPLHPKRLHKRGFNQCLEISRLLSRKLHVPLRPQLLQRTVHTSAQARLKLKDRAHNVANAFYAPNRLDGQHILLIDDIATTCATLRAATQTLLQAGAATVDVAVIARTSKHSNTSA